MKLRTCSCSWINGIRNIIFVIFCVDFLAILKIVLLYFSLWKDVEEFPHVALFSRSYLLHLADLVRRDQTQEIIAIFRMVLPSASKKLEKSIAALVKKASWVQDDIGSWLSTEDLFDILRQLQDISEIVFYEIGPELPLPPFLKSYSLTLRSHFVTQTAVILNVSRELLVGRYSYYYMYFAYLASVKNTWHLIF